MGIHSYIYQEPPKINYLPQIGKVRTFGAKNAVLGSLFFLKTKLQFLHLLLCIKVFCLNVKDIDQNMVQEISFYLPVEVHVASNIKVESA